ncbi:MAG: methylated-DNA--[protein]-cysteine S-methyltransferase [Pseudomonadota bacterium]|nr:methylated-DNA--[protein]-cysteine S-methyltransferase [Pseudomonadota bacterium]
MFYTFYENSPVGRLLISSDGENLTGLSMKEQCFGRMTETSVRNDNLPLFRQVKDWLDAYWQGRQPEIKSLPLKTKGSVFQQKVWAKLVEIPYGCLTTYSAIAGQIAAQSGKEKMSAQAVGGAVGRNPVGLIIPCHRVVGTNGCLTGYDGGLENKVILLRHEGVDMSGLFMPKQK